MGDAEPRPGVCSVRDLKDRRPHRGDNVKRLAQPSLQHPDGITVASSCPVFDLFRLLQRRPAQDILRDGIGISPRKGAGLLNSTVLICVLDALGHDEHDRLAAASPSPSVRAIAC